MNRASCWDNEISNYPAMAAQTPNVFKIDSLQLYKRQ